MTRPGRAYRVALPPRGARLPRVIRSYAAPLSQVLPISLIVVSDFEPGPKTWADEDAAVRRYAADPHAIPVEILVAAGETARATPHPDWSGLPVPVRVIHAATDRSAKLKDFAVAQARHDLVAVIEADCLAHPGWLAALHRVIAVRPDIGAVSGRTLYPGDSALRRVMALLDRGYLEERGRRGARHVSNNGALYRRDVLSRFPYDDDPSPFISAQRRQRAMRHGGVVFEHAADAVQDHAFGGWGFIRDVRRNKGYQAAVMRLRPGMGRWARLRCGLAAARALMAADRRVLGFRARYCLRRDLPLLALMLVYVRPFEWQGIAMALRGLPRVAGTAYR